METTLKFSIRKSGHPSEYNSKMFKSFDTIDRSNKRATLSTRLKENNDFRINCQPKQITRISYYTDSSYEIANRKVLEPKIVKLHSNFCGENLVSYGFSPSIIAIQNNNAKKLFEHLKYGKKKFSLFTKIEGEKMLLHNESRKFRESKIYSNIFEIKNPRNIHSISGDYYQASMRNINFHSSMGRKELRKKSFNIKYKGNDNFIYNVCIGLKKRSKFEKNFNKYNSNLKINHLHNSFLNSTVYQKQMEISNKIRRRKIPLQIPNIFFSEDHQYTEEHSRAQTTCENDKKKFSQNESRNNSKDLSLIEVLPARKICEYNHIKKVFKSKSKIIDINQQKINK